MIRLSAGELAKLSVVDQCCLIDAKREVETIETRAINPDPHWIAERRRRIEPVALKLELGDLS